MMWYSAESFGLLQLEDDRIPVRCRYRFDRHRPENADHRARPVRGELAEPQIAGEVEHDVIGNELTAVHRFLVVPLHPPADVQDDRRGVGLLPALGQLAGVLRHIRDGTDEGPLVSGQSPVAATHSLQDDLGGMDDSAVVPHVGMLGLPARMEQPGDSTAILGCAHHLAGGGGHHHFLLHRRGRFLLGGSRPKAGGSQCQTAQHGEARAHYVMHQITPVA